MHEINAADIYELKADVKNLCERFDDLAAKVEPVVLGRQADLLRIETLSKDIAILQRDLNNTHEAHRQHFEWRSEASQRLRTLELGQKALGEFRAELATLKRDLDRARWALLGAVAVIQAAVTYGPKWLGMGD